MGPLITSQLEQFKIYSKNFDWLDKIRPSKIATFVLIMYYHCPPGLELLAQWISRAHSGKEIRRLKPPLAMSK